MLSVLYFYGIFTTGDKGQAVVENLPLGKYTVKEKEAPYGFVLNTVSQDVEFVYANQNTPVIQEELTFANERQKVEITVVKKDAETDKELAGAVFGLYTKNDILADGKVIVSADALLEEAVSGEDGKQYFI